MTITNMLPFRHKSKNDIVKKILNFYKLQYQSFWYNLYKVVIAFVHCFVHPLALAGADPGFSERGGTTEILTE